MFFSNIFGLSIKYFWFLSNIDSAPAGNTVTWMSIPRWPAWTYYFFAQGCEAPSRQARVLAIGHPRDCNNTCVSGGRRSEQTAAIELNVSQCSTISDCQMTATPNNELIITSHWHKIRSRMVELWFTYLCTQLRSDIYHSLQVEVFYRLVFSSVNNQSCFMIIRTTTQCFNVAGTGESTNLVLVSVRN